MKNTAAAAAAAKKRSNSEGADAAAEPPAKRSNNAAAVFPSCYGLTPELIGHIARFLPMGTPDMMRLLLCVGPRVAAVVRKMYLTGNDYYLWDYKEQYGSGRIKQDRLKECIGYWMDYNEKAWKKRCLGKKHKGNIHTVMLTPKQFKSFTLGELDGLYCVIFRGDLVKEPALDEASLNVLTKLAENSPYLFLISIGDKYVDDGRLMTKEEYDSLVNSASVNSDGKMRFRFMRYNDALFALPRFFLNHDLVDILRFQIEEKMIEPSMMITSVDDDGNLFDASLTYLALRKGSVDCFRYLLSLPGTDINAIAMSDAFTTQQGYHENIIHSCLGVDSIPPSYLKDVLAHNNVRLDERKIFGETALCLGCRVNGLGDNTITKLRMLLEAGADPRIEDEDGEDAVFHLDIQIKMAQEEDDDDDDLEVKLKSLQSVVYKRIHELNQLEGRNT